MKIGILTFHNIPNFGAVLQAYSLCQALRSMGYESDIIDYRCENIVARELTYHPHPNKVKDVILKNLIWPTTEKKIRACQSFMTDAGVYSKEHYDMGNIVTANEKYDIFLSGSDMIWDFAVTKGDKTYLLDFVADEKPKYSYGSSCGDGIWDEKETGEVLRLLGRYQGIAVREKSMQGKLQSIGINSQLVSDPTMLLESEEWEQIAQKPSDMDYVLVYFPSERTLAAADEYARRKRKQVFVLSWGLPMLKHKKVSPLSPQEWIGYVNNASAVFTDSYHGLLYALYFNKPVWVGREGNRFNSIMDYLGIRDCYLSKDESLSNRIDYEKVNSLLSEMRGGSLNYLNSFKQ